MKIILTLVASRGLAPAQAFVQEFEQEEISIGRSADNDFVVDDPDRVCSRRHAVCYSLNGEFYIEDTSSSYTLLNESDRIERGNKRRLQDGDCITVGDVVLRVNFSAPQQAVVSTAQSGPGAFSIEDFFAGSGGQEPPVSEPVKEEVERPNIPFSQDDDFFFPELESEGPDQQDEAPDFDFSDLAGLADGGQAGEALTNERQAEEQPLEYKSNIEVEDPSPSYSLNQNPNKDFQNQVEQKNAQKEIAQNNSHREARVEATEKAIRAFIEGLGIKLSDLGEHDLVAIMGSAGVMLNLLTSGVIEMLKSRGEVKREFGMDTTQIAGAENNPLKFSISTEDAMLKLLVGAKGYLSAEESIKEGVSDAKAHQIAVMSGMQAALMSLLKRFEPQALEKQLQSGFVLSKKAKYWELYQQSYARLVDEAEDNFHRLFGDEFARVYMEQSRQLQSR